MTGQEDQSPVTQQSKWKVVTVVLDNPPEVQESYIFTDSQATANGLDICLVYQIKNCRLADQ